MPKKPILGYYRLRGWVGPIRLLLAYLEVDYEEKLYPNPSPGTGQGQWAHDKFSLGLDFPNIPYWIEEDRNVRLTETKAIMKHVCRRFDSSLLGTTELESSRANMLEDFLWDMWIALSQTCLHSTHPQTQKLSSDAPNNLKLLSTFLGDKLYLLGQQIVYVDFIAYEIIYHYSTYNSKFLSSLPELQLYLKRIENIPAIKAYMNSPRFIQGPSFSFKFKAQL